MGLNEIIQIGNVIRELRVRKGYSQKEMSELTGIPYSTYSNYENNNREPSKEQLQKIANALNIPLSEFTEILMKQCHLASLRNGMEGLQFGIVLQDVYDVLKGKNLELLKHFYKLNEDGKTKAIERVEELTEIKRYTEREEQQAESSPDQE